MYKVNIRPFRKSWHNVLFYSFIILIMFATLLPFLYVISGAFQSEWVIKTGEVRLLPKDLTLQNFKELLLTKTGVQAFSENLINSFKTAGSVSLITMTISALAAYGLAHYNFKLKETVGKILLFLYVFPTILAIYPIYNILAKMDLADTHLGLIMVHVALSAPFCTWLMRSFFEAIPGEILEAARVDGAGRFRIIVQIILPLAAAGILTGGMYAFVTSWGEYMFASIILTSGTKKTIPLALQAYMSGTDQSWGCLLAGCALNFIPMLVLFLPMLKTFLRGFTEGGVKQ